MNKRLAVGIGMICAGEVLFSFGVFFLTIAVSSYMKYFGCMAAAEQHHDFATFIDPWMLCDYPPPLLVILFITPFLIGGAAIVILAYRRFIKDSGVTLGAEPSVN